MTMPIAGTMLIMVSMLLGDDVISSAIIACVVVELATANDELTTAVVVMAIVDVVVTSVVAFVRCITHNVPFDSNPLAQTNSQYNVKIPPVFAH